MKRNLYLILPLILLFMSGCMTASHMKCPGFTAKRVTPNTSHTVFLHRHEKNGRARLQSASTQANAGNAGGMDIGGGRRAKQFEMKLPSILTASIKDDDIAGLNELFKVESKKTVSIEKKDNNSIYLKARSRRDFNRMVMGMARHRHAVAPDGGGGGGLGLAAGIIGIIAFVLAFGPYVGLLAFPLAIVAIILGILGLGSGRPGWAIAGIIFGILAILVAVLFLLLFFASFL